MKYQCVGGACDEDGHVGEEALATTEQLVAYVARCRCETCELQKPKAVDTRGKKGLLVRKSYGFHLFLYSS